VDPTGLLDVFWDGRIGFNPDDSNVYLIPHPNQYKNASWIDELGNKILIYESSNMEYSVALALAGFDTSQLNQYSIPDAKNLIEANGYTKNNGSYERNGLFQNSFIGNADGSNQRDSAFTKVLATVYDIISEVKNQPENIESETEKFVQYAVTAALFSLSGTTGSTTSGYQPGTTKWQFQGRPGQGLNNFSRAGEYGIKPYNQLRRELGGTGLKAHHLIEKRFADILEVNPRTMPSMALTTAEHRMFTNMWREAIPYGTGAATKESVLAAARQIYLGYPELLNALP